MLSIMLPPKGSRNGSFGAFDAGSPPEGARYPSVPHGTASEGVQFPLPRLSPGSGVHSPGSSVTSRRTCSPSANMHAGAWCPSSAIAAPSTGGCCSMYAGVRRLSSAIDAPMTEHLGGNIRQCGSTTPPSVSAMALLALLPPKRIACSPGEHFRISRLSLNERINRVKA